MIIDLLTDKPGTYAGVRVNTTFNEGYLKFVRDFGINVPGLLEVFKLHTTLLDSTKHLPKYVPTVYQPAIEANVIGYEVWDTGRPYKGNNNARCLVVTIDSPQLVNRHLQLMDEHKALYTFDQYIPHITLSYDIGEHLDIGMLVDFREYVDTFSYLSEYRRPLHD